MSAPHDQKTYTSKNWNKSSLAHIEMLSPIKIKMDYEGTMSFISRTLHATTSSIGVQIPTGAQIRFSLDDYWF